MRILFVQYTADWTGPSKSVLLLARSLRPEHQPVVALPGTGPLVEALEREGIRHVSFPSITKWQLPELARLVRREGFDLVYANNTSSTSRIGFFAARLGGAAFVCHVRGMGWDRSWLELGYLRGADAVVAVSRACAESVRRFVRPGRLHVVYNGVPAGELALPTGADRDRARSELGLPEGATIVISVAHVCERKGQLHAVEAMRRVLPDLPDAHLCLVGSLEREPGYVATVRARIREAGLEERVHLTGFCTDTPALLRGSDIFLHTAVADPHPRAVVEAMAAGRPVVAFDVDGVSETVLEGETGRLVPAGDDEALAEAIRGLLEAPEGAERMGAAGRRRVETTFTEAAAADGVRRVLESLGASRRGDRRGGDPVEAARP